MELDRMLQNRKKNKMKFFLKCGDYRW